MSYRNGRLGGELEPRAAWWKRPFLWIAAWLRVRHEMAEIEAMRDQEREYYMLGGLVLVREMREIRMREMDELRAREMGESVFESQAEKFLPTPPPLPVLNPGREQLR